jgi:LPXTG-motif cell wall-anchored protein
MNPDQLQLRDIHPPLLLPEEPNYALFAAGLLLVVLLAALLFWFFRLRKKTIVLPFAHETALADLARARSKMTGEQALQYAEEVSSILRCYVEKRFNIQTSRQTTKEFFTRLTTDSGRRYALFPEEHCTSLQDCLGKCDLAKFARCTPDQPGMKKMEAAVQSFIEDTRENREGGK